MTRGRPSAPRLSPTTILQAALSLLEEAEHPFTIRRLAARLEVTPMAILHHMGSHDALIRALSDALLAPVLDRNAASLSALLAAYAETIRHYPALTLALFRSAGPMPTQAQRLTETVAERLAETGLPPDKALIWRDILIDWAHGFALSQSPDDPAPALQTLLSALIPARSEAR